MNTVVLFDVMDTLVVDPYREMLAFFDCSWDELGKARDPGLWPAFERGEVDQETFLSGFFRDGRSFDRDAFLELFRGGYRWMPGMEALLEDLRQDDVEMHVLSNYPCWYRMIEEKLGLSRYLPWTFVSCKTGLRKPDAETFRQAAAALERPPSRCLFVDDQGRNCSGAEGVGMEAIQFGGAEALRLKLVARDLLGGQPA